MINDNIGSFKSFDLIFVNDVEAINELSPEEVTIKFKEADEYTSIPFQRKSAKVTAKPKTDDSGTVYDNTVSLIIPKHLLTAELKKKIQKAMYSHCLIKYETNNNETFLMGGLNYPLLLTNQKNHPGSASGLSGWQIEFTGKSTYPQREIVI